jgi:hypothetical protein
MTPRKTRRQESPAELEAMDTFLAFPRRQRVGWTEGYASYVLECLHTAPAFLPIDDDGKVRCRACYRERMQQAERMLRGCRGSQGLQG